VYIVETYFAMAVPYNENRIFSNNFDILRGIIVFASENL